MERKVGLPVDPGKAWTLDDPDLTGLDPEQREFRARLSRDIREGQFQIPPLPEVAVELNALANSPDPDIGAAVTLIERDAQLAAKVLQVASSASYGLGGPITDVRRASVRIGISGLRNVALALIMGPVFRCGPLDGLMREIMQHGFITACTTGWICRVLKIDNRTGFLCGLLHDVGKQALLAALARLARRYPQWLERAFVDEAMLTMHQEIGALVVGKWALPDVVRDCARFHHHAQEVPPERGTQPMVMAVGVANFAANLKGETAEACAETLRLEPLPYKAGLAREHLLDIARMVEQSRVDSRLLGLTA